MTPHPPLRRTTSGRVLGGVAAGVADHLGLPAAWVRVAVVLLALAGGLGVAVYAVFWVFLPQADGTTLREDRRGQGLLLGLLVLAVVAVGGLAGVGLLPAGSATAPLLVAVAGVALVWQQADLSQRARWRQSATSGPAGVARVVVGGALLLAGGIGFLASRGQLAVARAGLLSTVVVVVGLALLSSPWWFAMTSDLRAERRERIRSQERAEVAAHLHDSVLQTLALIQRSAGSPAEVSRLARRQERELRGWLYAEAGRGGTLQSALAALAAEVEDGHGVPVHLVSVGDRPLDERTAALAAAAREAVVNAARHSGAPAVDVYAEVEPDRVAVYVRDRGCGFDPDRVPPDRHGLAGSVHGRMQRHGGSAAVRSAPGEGTEVRLELRT